MRSIWAVATNTIRQALRMKFAAAFVILLLVLLPVMGASMTGDGTLKGRLQTFVSYGLSLTSILLCLLTIVVSAYSLTSDIKQRQIYTVITKPIRRFQLLLGKLLGVILLDMALLVLFSAIIYSITIYMPKFYNVTEAELAQVDNEFYTARASITPPEVDVSQEVNDRLRELEELGKRGELDLKQVFRGLSRQQIIAELTSLKKLEKRA
ncbi:MAG: ABC transporter permease, partial [Phycisphaerae bacterium]